MSKGMGMGMGMGMGKGKAGDEEDTSTEDLLKFYRRNCTKNGVTPLRAIEDRFTYIFDEGDGILNKLAVWDDIGPVGVRSFCDALKDVKYTHLEELRLWKTKAGDEGVRAACEYLKLGTGKLQIFDLLSNDITPLGCEFLGNILATSTITILKLDHNTFGTAGLAELARGLSKNGVLTELSLGYCGIDSKGAKYLQQILAFVKSELKILDLRGNFLRNEGVKMLMKVLEVNESLEHLNISDNQWGDKDCVTAICQVQRVNENLEYWDLNYNAITDEEAKLLVANLKEKIRWVKKLFLPEDQIDKNTMKELAAILKKNAKYKKKKKKGKKKKKKD